MTITRRPFPITAKIFVDPDTGVVLRLVTVAEFKNTDVVHVEDQRIDYLPVDVGGKSLVLPSKSIVNTEVVPNGDSGRRVNSSIRHTLFTSEYKEATRLTLSALPNGDVCAAQGLNLETWVGNKTSTDPRNDPFRIVNHFDSSFLRRFSRDTVKPLFLSLSG